MPVLPSNEEDIEGLQIAVIQTLIFFTKSVNLSYQSVKESDVS